MSAEPSMPRPGPLQGSVRARLLRPLAGLAVVVALLLAGVFFSAQRDYDARERATVAARVQAARSSFEERVATVRGMSRLVGHTPAVAEGVDAHDLRAMLDVVEPVARFASLGLMSIYSPEGVVLARGDAPAVFGKPDDLAPWVRSLGNVAERSALLDAGGRLLLLAATALGAINDRPVGWAPKTPASACRRWTWWTRRCRPRASAPRLRPRPRAGSTARSRSAPRTSWTASQRRRAVSASSRIGRRSGPMAPACVRYRTSPTCMSGRRQNARSA